MMPKELRSKILSRLERSTTVVALTGAGISAESGVPTFRGRDGLWHNHRPEELATPEAFARNPGLVWEWYNWRRGLIADKKPNPGHLALAALETKRPLALITQNVDGLHTLAGSVNVLEIHGSIWRIRCVSCAHPREDHGVPLPFPPLCLDCGQLMRPDVVWFGEALDRFLLEKAFAAVRRAEVMLVIGTSALVQPAASLAWQAKDAGAYVIEINTERTPFSSEADAFLEGPSGIILPELLAF
jgi:NAD-dependent deacetylase